MRFLALALVLGFICGCSGGSGAGGVLEGTAPPRKLTVRLAAQAPDPATVYYSAEFTLQLPAGVTVSAAPESGEIPSDVFVAADPSALVGARYAAASTAGPATVKVIIADPLGLVVGPLATLTCSATSGTIPEAASFGFEEFVIKDASGVPLATITPKLSVDAL